MRSVAENTGGRAIINTDARRRGDRPRARRGPRLLLVGYEPANLTPDGRFRRVEVKVNRPGVSVRSRSGYWAARPDEVVERRAAEGPTTARGLAGRAARVAGRARFARTWRRLGSRRRAAPTALPTCWSRSRSRFPPVRTPPTDTVTLIRNVYDERGSPGPPVREVVSVPLAPGSGEALRHDIVQVLSLAPGRLSGAVQRPERAARRQRDGLCRPRCARLPPLSP